MDFLVLCFFFFFLVWFGFGLHWVFAAVHRLSLDLVSVGDSPAAVLGLLIAERWLLLLQSRGSRQVGFRSCGAGLSYLTACGIFPE